MEIDAKNIDTLYKQLNTIVDSYFEHKVSAKALKLHFSKQSNIKRLLENNKLTQIKNISRVLSDVINDRYYSELDKKTFESTQETKDTIFWTIKNSGIYEERILSDYLHVSLSAIETVDSDTHHYQVKGKNYLVYTEHDISDFSYAIRKKITNKITESIIKYDQLEIEISNICDNNKLQKYIVDYVTQDVMIENISKELKVSIIGKETFKNTLILKI